MARMLNSPQDGSGEEVRQLLPFLEGESAPPLDARQLVASLPLNASGPPLQCPFFEERRGLVRSLVEEERPGSSEATEVGPW